MKYSIGNQKMFPEFAVSTAYCNQCDPNFNNALVEVVSFASHVYWAGGSPAISNAVVCRKCLVKAIESIDQVSVLRENGQLIPKIDANSANTATTRRKRKE